MQVNLKTPAKVGSLSFDKGINEVPEWTVEYLRNAGLVIEPKKKVVKKEEAKKEEPKKIFKKTKKTKNKSKK